MKRLILAAVALLCFSAQAIDVIFTWPDGQGVLQTNRPQILYPIWLDSTQPQGLTTKDRINGNTGATGQCIVSNLQAGTWQAVLHGRFQETTNWFTFPATNGLVWATGYVASSYIFAGSGIPAYSTTQADERFVNQTGDLMTGGLTNNYGFWENGLRVGTVAGNVYHSKAGTGINIDTNGYELTFSATGGTGSGVDVAAGPQIQIVTNSGLATIGAPTLASTGYVQTALAPYALQSAVDPKADTNTVKLWIQYSNAPMASTVHVAQVIAPYADTNYVLALSNSLYAMINSQIAGVSSFEGRQGAVSLLVSDIMSKLGYTPATNTRPGILSALNYNLGGSVSNLNLALGTNSPIAWVSEFGAVGASDDTAVFQAAINSGRPVFVPQRSGGYIVSNLYLTNHSALFGFGSKLVFKTGSTGFMLNSSNNYNVVVQGLDLDGNDATLRPATLGDRHGLQVSAYGTNNLYRGLTVHGFSGIGIQIAGAADATDTYKRPHAVLSDVQAFFCFKGLDLVATAPDKAEYIRINGFDTWGCYYGLNLAAGNVVITGPQINYNTVGIRLEDVSNSGHGSIIGGVINHNINAINATNIGYGFVFSGCNIWDGKVVLNGCNGISIENGIYDPAETILVNGGLNEIRNNWTYGTFANTITRNGDATRIYNNAKMDGSALLDNRALILGTNSALTVADSGNLSATGSNTLGNTYLTGSLYGPGTNEGFQGGTNAAWLAAASKTNLPTLAAMGLATNQFVINATNNLNTTLRTYADSATNGVLTDATNKAKAYTDSQVAANGWSTSGSNYTSGALRVDGPLYQNPNQNGTNGVSTTNGAVTFYASAETATPETWMSNGTVRLNFKAQGTVGLNAPFITNTVTFVQPGQESTVLTVGDGQLNFDKPLAAASYTGLSSGLTNAAGSALVGLNQLNNATNTSVLGAMGVLTNAATARVDMATNAANSTNFYGTTLDVGGKTTSVSYGATTNLNYVRPDFALESSVLSTNASFTWLVPTNVLPTKFETCAVLVTNTSGSLITIARSSASVATNGTWNCTNSSMVVWYHWGAFKTNAFCIPID